MGLIDVGGWGSSKFISRMEPFNEVLADQVWEVLMTYPLTKTVQAMWIVRGCHSGVISLIAQGTINLHTVGLGKEDFVVDCFFLCRATLIFIII